ncbi:MAG: D-alanyl-D-alanine carboxypeptidase [Myxococcales bacterium]|nr:D-alanyl-D-alanine carboxypeptidase [Myxococcales bacterium]
MVLIAASAWGASLDRALDEILADPALEGASVSVLVGTLDDPVYARDPTRRVVPASTTKLVTATVAARRLGLDRRFETVLAATGSTTGDVLVGDLVVVGGLDPSLGDGDPREAGRRVVEQVRALGIGAIEGDVVVDPSHGPRAPFGRGWMWDDLADAYSAPVSAANVGHNLAGEGTARCADRGGPGRPLLDPPSCLGSIVREELLASGITVGGTAVRRVPEAVEIARLSSAPLGDLLAHTLEVSDNLYAECVWLLVGDGDPATARARVRELMVEVGASDDAPVDGSGLSRYSHLSADSLVRVAIAGAELRDRLPVAGRTGTLSGRMVGTPAEGRVVAKTGSMTGVRNLVGHVRTTDGQELPFAFLIDGLRAPQAEAIALQDRFLATVASARRTRRGRWRLPPSDG